MTIDYDKMPDWILNHSYSSTYQPYTPTKKPVNKPVKKTIPKPVATKRQATPFLQTIMKGKEADTRIKLTQQQGKQPDYKDLLDFHKMSQEIELTYGMPSEEKVRDTNFNNNINRSDKNVIQNQNEVKTPHRKN